MAKPTRREILKAVGAAAANMSLGAALPAKTLAGRWDSLVIGAGVFGAWTARQLRAKGQRVLLIDARGPANALASSGGESRMTRAGYGADALYSRMALESLAEWRRLSDRAELPLFHDTGVLFFFAQLESYLQDSLRVHRELGLPSQLLERDQLRRRWPQIEWSDITAGLYEPEFGVLMARRAVQTLVSQFVADGGSYTLAQVVPIEPHSGAELESLSINGSEIRADAFVFACGPWLPKLLPQTLGTRIFPTRQEVFFFAPPAGDARFSVQQLPGWADFNAGDIYYGFPNIEGRGFKIAHDRHGPACDPDSMERSLDAAALADVRAYVARRFPALTAQPLVESRVCQYENSSNGDLLIDRHPTLGDCWLVGAGSGHGFKHGPAVGRLAASLVLGRKASAEPRFSITTKLEQQQRLVH
ncbi:MAG: FAD-dependent oxidoreductase [Steroidobacteraceae bacterium]